MVRGQIPVSALRVALHEEEVLNATLMYIMEVTAAAEAAQSRRAQQPAMDATGAMLTTTRAKDGLVAQLTTVGGATKRLKIVLLYHDETCI